MGTFETARNRWYVVLVCFALAVRAAPPDRALTKDGKLAGPLMVRDVQGGFAGFTGREWSVDPSGAFTVAMVRNRKADVVKKGDLPPERLAALVKELARCDAAIFLAGIPDLKESLPHA